MTPKQILLEGLKKEGLDVAEDAAAGAVKAVFKALPAFLLATENKYDDMLIPILGIVEPQVLAVVDKIDGEDDADR